MQDDLGNKYDDEFFRNYEKKYMTPAGPRPDSRGGKNRKKKNKGVRRVAILIIVALVSLAVILINKPKEKPQDVSATPSNVYEQQNEVMRPVKDQNTVEISDEIESEYAVMIDIGDGRVVASRSEEVRMYPASMTKIMTLLVAVENISDYEAKFKMTAEIIDPHYIAGASMAGFSAGEEVTVKDLLYGAILPSGADATAAIAVYISGNEEAFVGLMNKKVQQLGLSNTHFANPSGLFDKENYTTACDMAVILSEAIKNDMCREILSAVDYVTSPTPQHPDGIKLQSTLFSRIYGDEPGTAVIKSGKTGFVTQAGNCIASYGISNTGVEYIFVTGQAHGVWQSVYDHINAYKYYAK